MPKPIENALIEVSKPQTDPERLQELSEWKRKNERSRLRQAIAANPNSDEMLLLELAAEFPDEVVANPRFQLLLISDEHWWEDVEPISMLQLLAVLGTTAPSQARLDFFDQLGSRLASTDPLSMNMEWHMSFSEDITVEWLDSCQQESTADEEELEDDEELEEGDENPGEPREQEFAIEFSCVVEENFFDLCPPEFVEDPFGCLEKLTSASSSVELPDILMKSGWRDEIDYTPGDQGYWEIESVTPELDDWEFEANLLGDASGTIRVTDPAGCTHNFEIESGDHSDNGKYLNPTLRDHPDLIASIFGTDLLSSSELTTLLVQVIAFEKQSRGS